MLWALGGRLRTERAGAHASFLAAAGASDLVPVKVCDTGMTRTSSDTKISWAITCTQCYKAAFMHTATNCHSIVDCIYRSRILMWLACFTASPGFMHNSNPCFKILTTRAFLCAATEGPAQAAAFAWLGRFYREVASDAARARKCLQKALALDPTQADAGVWHELSSIGSLAAFSIGKSHADACLCSQTSPACVLQGTQWDYSLPGIASCLGDGRSVSIPTSWMNAGDALCEILTAAGSADTAYALAVEVTERSPR